jgi:REP element-mobilizing transposase RayT
MMKNKSRFRNYEKGRYSIRKRGHNYFGKGIYFITICTQNRKHLFGQVIGDRVELNSLGKIVESEWKATQDKRSNFRVHDFVVMPNHLHGIVEILESNLYCIHPEFKSQSNSIGAMIRGFKGSSTLKILNFIRNNNFNWINNGIQLDEPSSGFLQFVPTQNKEFCRSGGSDKIWQRNFYDVIIESEYHLQQVRKYIHENPSRWSLRSI